MALPTYSTGTASVAAGGTVVTGVGALWSGTNAKQGDFISINNVATVLVTEVTDATHLKVTPWPGAAQTGQTYVIYQNYVGRVVGVAAAEDVGTMLEKLHTDGLPFIVDPALTVPDPSYGDNGQFAFQPTTGKWWTKTGGVWVLSPGLTSDSSKVLKAGDTMTGDLTISKAGPQFNMIKSSTAEEVGIYGWNGANRRWKMVLGDATAETGSNTGSNFLISSRTDAGVHLATPFTISRASGDMTSTGNLTISKADPALVLGKSTGAHSNAVYGYVGSSSRWEIALGDDVAETGSNLGSNFGIYRFSDAGAYLSTAFYLNRNSGDAIFSNDLTWAGAAWAAYTPTISVGGGSATATGRYKQLGKVVLLQLGITVTASGTTMTCNAPVPVSAASSTYLIGRETASTGFAWLCNARNTGLSFMRYDNSFAVTTGWQMFLSGLYEAS